MKVLVWNIEKFTNEKFNDGYVDRGHFKKRKVYYTAAGILTYMQQVITGNGNAAWRPDVIAILEVLAPPADGLGAPLPLNSPGADGLLEMLGNIKAWTGNANWRLVPPLKCNPARPPNTPWAQSEVVGVFYDNTTVRFDGPNRWIAGASQPAGAGATQAYPAPWNRATVTLNTRNAGMVDFYLPSGRQLTFPGAGNRRPFVVDFTERAGLGRTIRFGFIHTSPGFHTAGTREFAHVQEMRQNGPADPAISIFAGDFNVNDYQVELRRQAFRPLQNQRFWKAFSKNVQLSTHFRKISKATPFNWYDYQGHKLIDNFLVRHKNPANEAQTQLYPKAAVDCAAGWPAPYVTTMHITIPNLLTYNNPTEAFRWWENFWHIRKCSDHVPTFMNIT